MPPISFLNRIKKNNSLNSILGNLLFLFCENKSDVKWLKKTTLMAIFAKIFKLNINSFYVFIPF